MTCPTWEGRHYVVPVCETFSERHKKDKLLTQRDLLDRISQAFLNPSRTTLIYLFCLRGHTAHLLLFNEPARARSIIM